MRGRGRMRMLRRGGAPMMMGGRPMHHMSGFKPRPHILRMPFDMFVSESFYPRLKPQPDDKDLTQALLKRHAELVPPTHEQTSIQSLLLKVQGILEGLTVAPGSFEACQLEEVRIVGSFKKGTMVCGHNVADLVVILKTLPTHEAIRALGAKILEEVQKQQAQLKHELEITDRGFNILSVTPPENTKATVRVLITTIGRNFRLISSSMHLDMKYLQSHLAAVRHSRWFEENVNHTSVKVLIRLLRDMRTRIKGLEPLSPWMIDLLAHFSVLNTPNRQALSVNLAFRRVIQLLSAGFFLPGSCGILDPCEVGAIRVHMVMTMEQEDLLCRTAQNLLRILSHGGYNAILGLDQKTDDPTAELSVWNGIVVTPQDNVYDSTLYERKTGEEPEDEEVEEAPPTEKENDLNI
ncbi:hypothetical protein GHT06_019880 [Daphnia sinensis]|uniref:DZF domain-containing protein n=1 Tax=Daphnia sinensis TaxID=1820382 RepID=A0AAD5KKQ5_9CRUS|nr:hypothetical protein GHT06_019880 [Daphnia sinensis]